MTIVTNALNIAFESSVRENIKVVVTGGIPRRQSYELIGPLVGASLDQFSLDVAVLGVDGLSIDTGATTLHDGEADASRRIASIARKVFIVADHTKIGHTTFARILQLDEIDVLVTDAPVPDAMAAQLDALNVQTVIAPSSSQPG